MPANTTTQTMTRPYVTPAARHRVHDRLARNTRRSRFRPRSTDALRHRREPVSGRTARGLPPAHGRRPGPRREDRRRGGRAGASARGATSLSGQTVGPAVILDVSKYLNRVGVVDRDRMTVRVEPGVVLDVLNAHLKPLGLMFGPDVSTSDRATLGGMIGNNSAGAASLRYGKTVDHVRALEVVLADGSEARFGPLSR